MDSRKTNIDMKHAKLLMCAGVALIPSVIAQAQVAGSTVLGVNALEQREVAPGWSTKHQLLGQPVFNDKSDRIGIIEDVVVAPDMARSYAIIGVGGFLGVRRHDVLIRLSQLRQVDDRFVLTGATKNALKALPPFEYAH
jgi:hypothetical protein